MCCCAKTKAANFKCCGIASVVLGGLVLIAGIAFPYIMKPLVIQAAKKSTALTPETQGLWRGIPGQYNISITRATHVYNCTNRDDVIYKGAIPNVTEIGPFVYQESNSWSEPKQWDVQTTVPGTYGADKKNAIEMVFNTKTDINWVLTKDPDFETPIWQINQAA